jgi:hypothetical protein
VQTISCCYESNCLPSLYNGNASLCCLGNDSSIPAFRHFVTISLLAPLIYFYASTIHYFSPSSSIQIIICLNHDSLKYVVSDLGSIPVGSVADTQIGCSTSIYNTHIKYFFLRYTSNIICVLVCISNLLSVTYISNDISHVCVKYLLHLQHAHRIFVIPLTTTSNV